MVQIDRLNRPLLKYRRHVYLSAIRPVSEQTRGTLTSTLNAASAQRQMRGLGRPCVAV